MSNHRTGLGLSGPHDTAERSAVRVKDERRATWHDSLALHLYTCTKWNLPLMGTRRLSELSTPSELACGLNFPQLSSCRQAHPS